MRKLEDFLNSIASEVIHQVKLKLPSNESGGLYEAIFVHRLNWGTLFVKQLRFAEEHLSSGDDFWLERFKEAEQSLKQKVDYQNKGLHLVD